MRDEVAVLPLPRRLADVVAGVGPIGLTRHLRLALTVRRRLARGLRRLADRENLRQVRLGQVLAHLLQEDVHVIGLSIISGAHNAIVPRVIELLRQSKMHDVLVLVGGIIPDQDIDSLKKAGVAAIFQPGTAMDDIVKFIRAHVKRRGVPTAG